MQFRSVTIWLAGDEVHYVQHDNVNEVEELTNGIVLRMKDGTIHTYKNVPYKIVRAMI